MDESRFVIVEARTIGRTFAIVIQVVLSGPIGPAVSVSAVHILLTLPPAHMNIFVGRLTHAITDLHLELLFGHFGEVDRARIITDRVTGESRGFGFVEMKSEREARKAIDKLDGVKLEGAILSVRPAHDRPVN